MSLTPWVAFVTVCEVGTISGAASLLGYTQSAVSRQVASLERDVGRPLLARGARGVRPTDAGRALLPHARVVVAEAERGRRSAASASPIPVVTVGAVPSAAVSLVPAGLARLATPMAWALSTGLSHELIEKTYAGEIDLAVVTDAPPGLPPMPDLVVSDVAQDRMAVVVSTNHRLARRKRVSIADLASERWLEDNRGSETLLRQLAADGGVVGLEIDHSPGDLGVKTALVAAGQGVALVPRILAPALRADVRLLEVVGAPRRGLYALTKQDRRDLTAVVDALRGA